MSAPLEILVLGAGAMGSLFGGRLSEIGCSVTLVDIDQAHLDIIRRDGLRLVTDTGDRRVPIRALRPEQVTGFPDLVIVFTKTMHTEAALASIKPALGPDTHPLTLQNGLGNLEKIQQFVPAERICMGITTWPADLRGPGYVESRGSGKIRMMSADGRHSAFLDRVKAAFDAADLHCEIDPHVIVAIWEKIAFNAALNAICAAAGCRVGAIERTPGGRELALAVADEVVAVAKAQGIAADQASVRTTVNDAIDTHQAHMPSMAQDVLAGRPTEIEAINGAVVQAADALGVPVPLTRALLTMVRMVERRDGAK